MAPWISLQLQPSAKMAEPSQVPPSWVGIILLVLTFGSFIPQWYRIFKRRDCTGIPLISAVLNLVNFNEQFFMAFVLHDGVQDWISYAQLALPCAYWLIILIASLFMPSKGRLMISQVFSLYGLYVLLSVASITVWCMLGDEGLSEAKILLSIVFLVRFCFLQPLLAVFGLGGAALAQASAIPAAGSSASSLSMTGLATQAVAFAIQAVFWFWRTGFPKSERGFWAWYMIVGWLCVPSAVYAIAQMAVWVAAAKNRATVEDLMVAPETEPLLSSQATNGEPLSESR
ncbi:hypothetical protein GGS24DRAFT_199291 [Hypoxylon argillaceum]|nr:hypothetical protein GGS24DRAFT_199291 [Hypoxylon argillaceum]